MARAKARAASACSPRPCAASPSSYAEKKVGQVWAGQGYIDFLKPYFGTSGGAAQKAFDAGTGIRPLGLALEEEFNKLKSGRPLQR